MRLFVISLAIAAACLLPDVAEVQDWALPGWVHTIVLLPRAGLGYMNVFFHELGHTVTSWSYGQVAVPAFNFADGGGVAMPLFDRSLILQGIVYIIVAFFAYWHLFLHWRYWEMGALAAALLVHLAFSGGDYYRVPIGYMGNGGSVLLGCYCIYRAALNRTYSEHSPTAERYLNMIFGLFAIGYGFVLAWQLIWSDLARAVYDQGIGGHITNDFTAIADRLNTTLRHVAGFHLLFVAAALAVTFVLIWLARRTEKILAQESG
jgi:hypothetical protein